MLIKCGRHFNAEMPLVHEMVGFISAFASDCGLNRDRVKTIELAAEEAIVNIINYAYKDSSKGEVSINCTSEKTTLTIEIIDSGIAFNPLETSNPNLTDNLEDRKIGGLGIFFIKSFIDEVHYRRENGKNILSLIVRDLSEV